MYRQCFVQNNEHSAIAAVGYAALRIRCLLSVEPPVRN